MRTRRRYQFGCPVIASVRRRKKINKWGKSRVLRIGQFGDEPIEVKFILFSNQGNEN